MTTINVNELFNELENFLEFKEEDGSKVYVRKRDITYICENENVFSIACFNDEICFKVTKKSFNKNLGKLVYGKK